MKKNLNEKSESFKITYYGLELEFKLFSIDYIFDKLKVFEKNENISSIHRLTVDRSFRKTLRNIYIDSKGKEIYHYFAYIKFFVYNDRKYGLVGGKTNYPNPDVALDYHENDKDKRIARIFLLEKNIQWHNEIIIVNHEPIPDDRERDNQQAIFLEQFLQRQFNLLNS